MYFVPVIDNNNSCDVRFSFKFISLQDIDPDRQDGDMDDKEVSELNYYIYYLCSYVVIGKTADIH